MPSLFDYCPQCKSPQPEFLGDKELVCRSCGWNYFHNVAAAVAVFIRTEGKLLFIRRGKEPGKGMLDLPGGFVDPAESAEEALRREMREELGTELKNLRYLCSFPNRYLYNHIWYNTCDLYFTSELDNGSVLNPDREEIAALELIPRTDYIKPAFPENMAFESAKNALRYFTEQKP